MYRLTSLAASASKYRIFLQLGLLAIGLLAVSFAGGAPDCESGSGTC